MDSAGWHISAFCSAVRQLIISWLADILVMALPLCLMVGYVSVSRAQGISGLCAHHHPAGMTVLAHTELEHWVCSWVVTEFPKGS